MTEPRVTLHEQPGWTAISAGGVHVLLRGTADTELVGSIREALSSGELDDVLDALSRGGVRQAPDFAAVQEGEPLRVVVRGTAYAAVSAAGGDSEIRAARRGPWADEDAPVGTTAVVLHSGEVPPEPEPEVVPEPVPVAEPGPVRSPEAEPQPAAEPRGWKVPTRLARAPRPPVAATPPNAADDSAEQPGTTAGPAPGQVPHEAPDEVDELPSYDHLFGATQQGLPRYIEDHDTSNISEPPIGHAPIEAAGGFSPSEAPGGSEGSRGSKGSDHTLPPPADTHRGPVASTGTGTSTGAGAPSSQKPEPDQPIAPPSRGGLIDSVPWRSGGSNVPPPELPRAAEARVGGVHTPPPAPSLRPALPPAPPSHTPSPAPQPAPAQPAADAPSAGDDADEATVDRSALLAATGADRPESGPMVLAVLCPAGHPSSPHAGRCRVCARDIPAQQPFQTPRPPLGVLRLSTGDVVSLDRGVLLGRSPKLRDEIPVAERPHLVRVASPENDISRNHVEVVLEDWHVLVRDLGSTNGTTVALPGQVPVRLRSSDQQVIEPGTVVAMADEVSFTFEASA